MYLLKTNLYLKSAEGHKYVFATGTRAVNIENLFYFADTTKTMLLGVDKNDVKNQGMFARDSKLLDQEYSMREIVSFIRFFKDDEDVVDKEALINYLSKL